MIIKQKKILQNEGSVCSEKVGSVWAKYPQEDLNLTNPQSNGK